MCPKCHAEMLALLRGCVTPMFFENVPATNAAAKAIASIMKHMGEPVGETDKPLSLYELHDEALRAKQLDEALKQERATNAQLVRDLSDLKNQMAGDAAQERARSEKLLLAQVSRQDYERECKSADAIRAGLDSKCAECVELEKSLAHEAKCATEAQRKIDMLSENEDILRVSLHRSMQRMNRLCMEVQYHKTEASLARCNLTRAEVIVEPALAWAKLRDQFEVARVTPADQKREFPNTMTSLQAEKDLHASVKLYNET